MTELEEAAGELELRAFHLLDMFSGATAELGELQEDIDTLVRDFVALNVPTNAGLLHRLRASLITITKARELMYATTLMNDR